MSFPSDKTQDSSYLPSSRIKNTRGQQRVWGIASNTPSATLGSNRGLASLSTAPVSTTNTTISAGSSPARNTFGTFSQIGANLNPISSRHSSVSSSSSVLSPTATSSQQTFPSRSKPITSPHLGSSSNGFANLDRNGSASGPARYSRQHSAGSLLSSFGGAGATATSTPSGGQLTSLVLTQLNILLSTLKEDKDRLKWESQVDKIYKVRQLSLFAWRD